MNSIDLTIRARAAELAAASEFPDADPRLFLSQAFREVVMGKLPGAVRVLPEEPEWSPYQ